MKPEPSPFWTKHRVNPRDIYMLYHTHPEMRELSLVVIDDVDDDFEAFYRMFNSLSEEQRAMVYDWANRKRAQRLQVKEHAEQLKVQAEITAIQQEIEVKNQARINKLHKELEEELNKEPEEPEPRTFFGRMKYKYKKWKQRRVERQKQREEEETNRELDNLMAKNSKQRPQNQQDQQNIHQQQQNKQHSKQHSKPERIIIE